MHNVRLVLEKIVDVHVLAHILGQFLGLFNLDTEDNFFAKELLWLIFEVVRDIGFAHTIRVAGLEGASQLACKTALYIGCRGKDGTVICVTTQNVAESLQLQVALTNKDGLGRIPERVSVLVGEVRNFAVILNVLVVHGAHHFHTVRELFRVPHIEVPILTVVNLDLEDTLLCLNVSKVWHLACELGIETDVPLEVSSNHVCLSHHRQDLFQG